MKSKTRTLVTLAMLCALAFLAVVLLRIHTFEFLTFDVKDVIITIGGFIFGPFAAFAISVVVSLIEMITISSSGIIGCVMNILASCAFACTASLIYKRNHTMIGAIIGLLCGVLAMTSVMLLWNYLITPLYMNVPREDVIGMLIPIFLPFNLLKGGANAAITLLLYKPLVTILRKAHLVPESIGGSAPKKDKRLLILIYAVALITAVLLLLVILGIL